MRAETIAEDSLSDLVATEAPVGSRMGPDRPAAGSVLVALERVSDPLNLGSIFRNAAAFGARGVVLCPRCSDPLYRKWAEKVLTPEEIDEYQKEVGQ